jgi:hypothetical protein
MKKLDILDELDSLAKIYDNPIKCSARDSAIEIRKLREALRSYATCSDGCTCGDGWSHDAAREALNA